MKHIISSAICVMLSLTSMSAQEMRINAFYHEASDKTANQLFRSDLNGNRCALIIVDIDAPLMKFYGNVIGPVERHQGKYYVYMTDGSKKLKVQHTDLAPLAITFSDYDVNNVSSGQTYYLNISLPEVAKNSTFAADDNDTSQPKHLSLMCVKDNKPEFFTKEQWNNLDDKNHYSISGLVIIDREEQFVISLHDYGEYSETEIRQWLSKLPTESQIQAIINDLDNIQGALESFGGQKLLRSYYMVSPYENELILCDTDLSWEFAHELNTLHNRSNVRPTSARLDSADADPFKLPAPVANLYGQISNARSREDYAEAIRLCMSIPDDPVAQYYLGVMYENGQGVEQDIQKALDWYKKGASQGDSDCQYEVGRLFQYGIGVDQDYSEAAKYYTQAANKGDKYAQTALGFMYVNGQGVDKDFAKAVTYLSMAAENGMSDAQNCLGWMYEYGNGVEINYTKALDLYLMAAQSGHVNAQFNLGMFHYFGKGTPVNYAQAMDWWMKAAQQGNSAAQSNIAHLYKSGEGVRQDYAKAIEWYKKSAAVGDASGENGLGDMYLNGLGVSTDYDEALRLFKSAADKGNREAQYNLGEMYEKGLGLVANIDTAKNWYIKAADNGYEKATDALNRINGKSSKCESSEESLLPDFDEVKALNISLFDETIEVLKVRKGTKFGVYSKSGLELVSCKYDDLIWLNVQAFAVELDKKYGIVTLGGEEIIPVTLNSRPINRMFQHLSPWYIETTSYLQPSVYEDALKSDVILVTFDGTPFYSYKFKEIFNQNKIDKLVKTMNAKFEAADKKANSKYSILGQQKIRALEKNNTIYFKVLKNDNNVINTK